MNKAPKKRNPSINPLPRTTPGAANAPAAKPDKFEVEVSEQPSTKWKTCPGCMGLGGMDGGCRRCGGTGYL
jgi:hypothetical protein